MANHEAFYHLSFRAYCIVILTNIFSVTGLPIMNHNS